jgi:hypothetical protein
VQAIVQFKTQLCTIQQSSAITHLLGWERLIGSSIGKPQLQACTVHKTLGSAFKMLIKLTTKPRSL